jgi:transposase
MPTEALNINSSRIAPPFLFDYRCEALFPSSSQRGRSACLSRTLVRRWAGCQLVFEASMNWHWLFVEILEREVPSERIVLANPFKTRIIAEAQIKSDKVDARILADLLRGRLVSSVHIAGRETRQIKEVLRQRCFFVRQRTMLRNRIHGLLGGQHELKLPQCSDHFGRKGVGFLEKLELPASAKLLST